MLIAIERGDLPPELPGDAPHSISVVSVSELLHGVHRARSPVRSRRRIAVERLLAALDALPITEEVARVHAEIGAELVADGTPVATNDLWIGCTALVHDAAVATRDRRSFERVPGLHVIAA